ncbi:hypothetical protein SYNPS1DRAFT_23237 [Syncephalis pseudoplumigaleata]|uniref:Centromere protein H C-terminal domain-containing protein n=1 Tax=Syncephalis pseudoplumigaleata TaxID=1712513 RepID=A0A4P9YXS7_9FUNG|nr:hypothetical protein SYNPS1DRAFT_23237 [Syncephalis pseudoplumigaleata]|eukprot:RKP24705.1 hypothetical protein SYNPS1DRAFT_23237 [Syncephalis pseudoplumigaleata]
MSAVEQLHQVARDLFQLLSRTETGFGVHDASRVASSRRGKASTVVLGRRTRTVDKQFYSDHNSVPGLIRIIESLSTQYDKLQRDVAQLDQESIRLTGEVVNEALFTELKQLTGDASFRTGSLGLASLDEAQIKLNELLCQNNTLRRLFLLMPRHLVHQGLILESQVAWVDDEELCRFVLSCDK